MKSSITCALGIWLGVVCGVAVATDHAAPSAESRVPEPAATMGITPAELAARVVRQDPELVVLDVRTTEEFAAGHVPGARNVSHDQLHTRLNELASLKDKDVVLYCRSGRRAQLAARTLREAGFTRILQLEGDYPGWEASRKADSPSAPATE
jgi:phage shock protein E